MTNFYLRPMARWPEPPKLEGAVEAQRRLERLAEQAKVAEVARERRLAAWFRLVGL